MGAPPNYGIHGGGKPWQLTSCFEVSKQWKVSPPLSNTQYELPVPPERVRKLKKDLGVGTHDESVQLSHLPARELRHEIDDFVLEHTQAECTDDPVCLVDSSISAADCHQVRVAVVYLYHVLVV